MESSLTSKLALGTVQFGLGYGINNTRGRVPVAEVAAILSTARAAGVGMLDTSGAYGCAEEILGPLLASESGAFEIVSKLPRCPIEEVDLRIERSFRQLGLDSLYGYLCHHYDFFREVPGIWDRFRALRDEGRARRIGFSLYHPRELAELFDDGIDFDLVQVPGNVLDRRFEPLFAECHRRGIEVHVRSVFLQGLLLRNPDQLPAHFLPIQCKIRAVHAAAEAAGISPSQLLLIHAGSRTLIDRIVIGVDSLADLQSNLIAADHVETAARHFSRIDSLQEDDERMILPSCWPK